MVILLQGVWSNIEDTGKLETQRRVLMVSVETMRGSYEAQRGALTVSRQKAWTELEL